VAGVVGEPRRHGDDQVRGEGQHASSGITSHAVIGQGPASRQEKTPGGRASRDLEVAGFVSPMKLRHGRRLGVPEQRDQRYPGHENWRPHGPRS